jgi:AcrR family transcriptional regulator
MKMSPSSAKPLRKRQPAATKQRLVMAALEVIKRGGFEAAGTAQIAKQAGLTNGAIYAHFVNRDELIAAALREHMSSLRTMIVESDKHITDPIDAIENIVRAWNGITPRDGGVVAEMAAKAGRDKVIRELFVDQISVIETAYIRWLRLGQERGQVKTDIRPEAVARLLTSVGTGYQCISSARVPALETDDWIALLLHILESLRPPPTSSAATRVPKAKQR